MTTPSKADKARLAELSGRTGPTKPATKAAEGEETRTCGNDPSHTETRSISKLPNRSSGGHKGGGDTQPDTPETPLVTVEQPVGGDLSVTPADAQPGDTVTVTPQPDQGYEVEAVTVTDQVDGTEIPVTDNGDGTYSFTGPEGGATVRATFKKTDPADPDHNCAGDRFADVDVEKWYHEFIDYVVEKGLMNGVSDTEFRPNGTLSRAMLVTILHRLAGGPAAAEGKDFSDVKEGKWYSDAVAWASEQGIVNGFQDETFRPNDPITREQLATILYRFAQTQGLDPETVDLPLDFSDADQISAWADEALRWCVEAGLMEGKGEGRLDPKGETTRAQTAAILMRFCESILK